MRNRDFALLGEAVMSDLTELAGFSETEGPGVTRPSWGAPYLAARDWLAVKARESGLECVVDPIGNLWCTWPGTGREHLIVGSHIDTVPDAGRFDGCLGVLGGLHAIRLIRESGARPSRSVHLVAWIEEEGTSTGTTLLGSRTFAEMAGRRMKQPHRPGDSELLSLMGPKGEALLAKDESRSRNWDGVPYEGIVAYLELHIEQGPVLEFAEQQIGVVDTIVGYRSAMLDLQGQSNHAGTTPMAHRSDALVAAARIVTAVRDQAMLAGVTATVGSLLPEPNAANVISGHVSLTMDVRAPNDDLLDTFVGRIAALIEEITGSEGVTAALDWGEPISKAPMDRRLREVIRASADELGHRSQDIISGALHDAAAVSRLAPAGMIFVPSHLGISHAPGEFTTPDDCGRGIEVLTATLRKLID